MSPRKMKELPSDALCMFQERPDSYRSGPFAQAYDTKNLDFEATSQELLA